MNRETIVSYEPKMKKTVEVIQEIFINYDSLGKEAPHIYELENQIEQLTKELKLCQRLHTELFLAYEKLKEKINETDSDR